MTMHVLPSNDNSLIIQSKEGIGFSMNNCVHRNALSQTFNLPGLVTFKPGLSNAIIPYLNTALLLFSYLS